MKIQNQEAKEKLVQRLRRIEGQVRGVQGMLDEERDCREIMQQLVSHPFRRAGGQPHLPPGICCGLPGRDG